MGKIDTGIQQRVVAAMDEMNQLIKERSDVIKSVWIGRIAQEHVLMLGPGGTGKSFLARSMWDHIDGSTGFESAFDETTDPSQVFGPPDIKAMVENGKTRRVVTNMLPEATDAFLDEFFNGNGPLLHSLQPVLNERVFHNNGIPHAIPLRQAIMGTNKINADVELAPLFDRVHIRHTVDYTRDRSNQSDMVGEAIARMSLVGRGVTTSISASHTKVTVDELDQAHKEALSLDVDEAVMDLFLDIKDELKSKGIVISDRRMVEGMAAVLASAWIAGHEQVKPGDLDILANMWWVVQDHAAEARSVVLAATNPGEKAALDLLDELDKIKKEIAESEGLDEDRRRRVGVEAVRNTDKLIREAQGHKEKSLAAGASTERLQETIEKAQNFKIEVGRSVFHLDPTSMAAMTAASNA